MKTKFGMLWKAMYHRKDKGLEKWKKWKKQRKEMPQNIYDDKYYDQHYKNFHRVHFTFKYKFLLPLAALAKLVMGKALRKKPLKTNYNVHLTILDEAWDMATKKWYAYYIRKYTAENKRFDSKRKMLDRLKKKQGNFGGGQWALKTVKELLLTGIQYDTVYREWSRIFMDEVTRRMLKHYKNKDNIHMFWVDHDVYDPNYFAFYKQLKVGEVFLKDSTQTHIAKQDIIDACKKARLTNIGNPVDTLLELLDLELEVDDEKV